MLKTLFGFFMSGGSSLGAIAIVIGVVALVSGTSATLITANYYNKLIVTSSTHAAQYAYVQATQAQAATDAKDYAKDKADYDKRHAQDEAANASLKALLAQKNHFVPNPTHFKFSADAMKQLNDPSIVGAQ